LDTFSITKFWVRKCRIRWKSIFAHVLTAEC
jgi:hypothetical protein